MTITFDNAPSISLPVSGNALSRYTRYFSFEDDEFGSIAPKALPRSMPTMQPRFRR